MGHFEMSEGTPIPDYHCVKSRFGDRSDKDFVLLLLFSMFTINEKFREYVLCKNQYQVLVVAVPVVWE